MLTLPSTDKTTNIHYHRHVSTLINQFAKCTSNKATQQHISLKSKQISNKINQKQQLSKWVCNKIKQIMKEVIKPQGSRREVKGSIRKNNKFILHSMPRPLIFSPVCFYYKQQITIIFDFFTGICIFIIISF